MKAVNIKMEKMYKADVEFSRSDRLGLFYSSSDHASPFNQAYMDAMKESLKTLKTKRDHKAHALNKALDVMVIESIISENQDKKAFLSDLGFFDSEGTYVIDMLFNHLDRECSYSEW